MPRSDYLHSRLWALTEEQDGVLSRRQLLDGNLTISAVEHRVATGRLWPVHRHVFAVGRPQLSIEGRWRAALLAVGDDAVLSSTTAAALWGLRDEPGDAIAHVAVPTRSRRGEHPAIAVHRCPGLCPDDVTEHRGFRVTTLARTHLDLTAPLGVPEQRAALRESEYRHRLDLGALRRSLADAGRSVPHGRLRKLLDEWVPGIGMTESELEARFLTLCRRRGIPLPRPQRKVAGYRVDFLWPALHLVAETDGYESHRGRIAFQRDRAKDRALQARGYGVLRFTWAEVVAQPRRVATELVAAQRRRARELSV